MFGDIWLTPTSHGLLEENVSVDFNPKKYGRRRRNITLGDVDDKIADEMKINEFWLNQMRKNKRLYNKSKFRLACCSKTVDDAKGEIKIDLKVGLTDYKVNPGTYINKYINIPTRTTSRTNI